MLDYRRTRAFCIAAASVPVYIYLAYLNVVGAWDAHTERVLARSFVACDAAASADARTALEALRQRQGTWPAVHELLAALDTVHNPDTQRAIVDLLGTLSLGDSAVVSALMPLARQQADLSMRMLAFASLRKFDRTVLAVTSARYVGLTPTGLVTFALPTPHPLCGDTVSAAVAGLVLARPDSQDGCEVEAAGLATAFLASELAGAKRIKLEGVNMTADGGFSAAVKVNDSWLNEHRGKKVPGTNLTNTTSGASANFNWYAWLRDTVQH